MINIIGKRYIFITLSILIIGTGIVLLIMMYNNGTLPLAIDFTGGSLLEVTHSLQKLLPFTMNWESLTPQLRQPARAVM